jgi:hypothetical protein
VSSFGQRDQLLGKHAAAPIPELSFASFTLDLARGCLLRGEEDFKLRAEILGASLRCKK